MYKTVHNVVRACFRVCRSVVVGVCVVRRSKSGQPFLPVNVSMLFVLGFMSVVLLSLAYVSSIFVFISVLGGGEVKYFQG